MTITDIITLVGAIATFLFGMSTMTDGLEKLSSGRLEGILERLTSNVWKGVLLGALVTGLIQSSAATTVMCVGFVNAGIMRLEQTVGIIMGANIGTTVTAQLLRLGDISSDNVFLALLKSSVRGPLLAAVGVVLYLFLKGGRRDRLRLVEGYMDVVSLYQHGVDGCVATLGTALTPEQIRLMKRYAPEILLTYDGVTYAAAMNGMPHGGERITTNNFDGQFCIHFLNSRTHGGNQVNEDMQARIMEAFYSR